MNKWFVMLAVFLLLPVLFLSSAFASQAKTKTIHRKTIQGFSQVQVVNETARELACYVAIDGHKIKFRLPPRRPSKWYTANDKRFSYTNFSTWCDFLDNHPEYEKYGV